MSRDATSPGASHYHYSVDSGLPTQGPLTVAIAVRPQTFGDLDYLFNYGEFSPEDQFGVRIRTSSGGVYQWAGGDGSAPYPGFTISHGSTDTWALIVADCALSSDQNMAVDGGTKTNNTTSFDMSAGTAEFWIGTTGEGNAGWQLDGYIGPCAIWGKVLSQAECDQLYVSSEKYTDFRHTAEDNLLFSWPIYDDETAHSGYGSSLTETGTITYSTSVHPTMVNRITRSNFVGF